MIAVIVPVQILAIAITIIQHGVKIKRLVQTRHHLLALLLYTSLNKILMSNKWERILEKGSSPLITTNNTISGGFISVNVIAGINSMMVDNNNSGRCENSGDCRASTNNWCDNSGYCNTTTNTSCENARVSTCLIRPTSNVYNARSIENTDFDTF
jgi:hypothetical protein